MHMGRERVSLMNGIPEIHFAVAATKHVRESFAYAEEVDSLIVENQMRPGRDERKAVGIHSKRNSA